MSNYEALSLTSVVVVLAGSAWAWSRIARRHSAGLPTLSQEPAYTVPWSVLDVVIMLGLVFLFNSVLYTTAVNWLGMPKLSGPDAAPELKANAIFLFSVSGLLSLLLMLVVVPLRTGATFRQFGFASRSVLRDIGLGVTAFFALSVPVYLVQLVLTLVWKETSHPLVELLREDPSPKFFLMSAFSAVLVAPLVEEFLFRVLLQGWVESAIHRQASGFDDTSDPVSPRSSMSLPATATDDVDSASALEGNPHPSAPVEVSENPFLSPVVDDPNEPNVATTSAIPHPSLWAIVISAFLFAIAHANNGPDPIPLFVFAFGLGYLYQRTRRILPCIVVHLMLNSLTLYQLWLYVHMEP